MLPYAFNNVCIRKLHYLKYYWTSFILILPECLDFLRRRHTESPTSFIHYHLILLLQYSTFIIMHNRHVPKYKCTGEKLV